MKTKLLSVLVIWVSIIGLSLYWNIKTAEINQKTITFQTARTLFDLMVITRRWNAGHNGLYVEVSDNTQPNPYLNDPKRDLACKGLELTKMNPAYMTRQISALTGRNIGIRFHVAGLNPVNPGNAPDPWEKNALELFTSSSAIETGERHYEKGQLNFTYMKGLKAEKSCLECHKNHPYKIDDIIGGIRIDLFDLPKANLRPLILWHTLIGVIGVLLIWIAGLKLISAYQTIRQQAVYDALTNIPNRRAFNDRIEMEIRQARRMGTPLSVIMADIDNFKSFNDIYGHNNGDQVLSMVARTIDSNVRRPIDFCARYGGEEFVIILPNTDENGAAHLADQLLEKIRNLSISHEGSKDNGVVTLSLGITTERTLISERDQLVQKADKALYLAKSNGKDRFEIF